jgi:hypothetical protein
MYGNIYFLKTIANIMNNPTMLPDMGSFLTQKPKKTKKAKPAKICKHD